MPQREIDHRFLAALQAGIPNTSGVALGVDRLIMIALGAESIKEVISFSVECALSLYSVFCTLLPKNDYNVRRAFLI